MLYLASSLNGLERKLKMMRPNGPANSLEHVARVKRSETRVFISGAGQSPDFASLHPGYLLYGSLGGVTVLGNGSVQLGPDTFNFNMENGRPFRN